MKKAIFIDPETRHPLLLSCGKENHDATLSSNNGRSYKITDGVAQLIYPENLNHQDAGSRDFYEGRADQYEDTLHLTFVTHNLDEMSTRQSFIDKLRIGPGSKVLEVACGTGRDSALIADRVGASGELHLQDISADMMRVCHRKLEGHPAVASFALANALHLPYPDKYFDGVYSFGALGEFSDQARALKEMVRVAKAGARIVVGDESVPVWLRETEFYRILKETNPMFEALLPLAAIPVEARETSIHFVIGQAFYLIEFIVGDGEPHGNFDFPIPGVRGGTYRTRYQGKLEGISPEAKKLAWDAVKKRKTSMHDWLDKLVRSAAEKELRD
jgi:ubiquinone/menaquinone biosynthesis C-methylase UbiE